MNVKRQTARLAVGSLLLTLLACGGGTKQPSEGTEQKAGAPSGGQAVVVDLVNGGTITGKVSYEGEKPKPAQIRMNAEAYCASAHKEPVYSDQLVVNESNGLEYVFVYVKEGLGDKVFEPSKDPVVLDQRGCMYSPHIVGVQVGQPIEVKNSDPTTHNIHPVPAVNREWNKSMAPGVPPIEQTFAREEIMIPVKCNVHPWMKSYIGVVKHPFFAITGKDGTFEIKGLPPGEYTIEAWHEKLGTLSQKVSVAAKESKTVDFTMKASS